jgi:hypothetical protein
MGSQCGWGGRTVEVVWAGLPAGLGVAVGVDPADEAPHLSGADGRGGERGPHQTLTKRQVDRKLKSRPCHTQLEIPTGFPHRTGLLGSAETVGFASYIRNRTAYFSGKSQKNAGIGPLEEVEPPPHRRQPQAPAQRPPQGRPRRPRTRPPPASGPAASCRRRPPHPPARAVLPLPRPDPRPVRLGPRRMAA